MLSRLCEEFGGWPHEAAVALDEDPERWVLRVLPLRGFASAYKWKDKVRKEWPDGSHAAIDEVIGFDKEEYDEAEAKRLEAERSGE